MRYTRVYHDMQHILDDVESRITTDYCYTVSLSDVKFAVSRLKALKNDGDYGLNSNHVIHANNDLLVHIGCMLNAAVVHGVLLDSCLRSTIVPIPKDRNNNVMDSGNYR